MPFNAIPAGDFYNREDELNFLRHLAASVNGGAPSNILLQGAWGMGKTELLKQLYRDLFWGDKNVVPFYYAFRRATLHAGHFARDYFMRFVRQYLAFVKKSPSFADNMYVPLSRLTPVIASSGMEWMVDLIYDFEDLQNDGSLREQMLGAIMAPVAAARESGMSVLVMLDDFPLAKQIYETREGDAPGLISLFEGSIKSSLCPHILTGSPDGVLERIFSDNALRGKAERLFVGPLPENAARALFGSLCERIGIPDGREASRNFIRTLGGNPSYLRNMAGALRKMHKKEISENDLWEAYSLDVSEGQTAFYWSSIFEEFMKDGVERRAALEFLMRSAKADAPADDPRRLSSALGVAEPALRAMLEALRNGGLITPAGRKGHRDAVFEDYVHCLYMKEREGRTSDKIRGLIEKKYFPAQPATEHFEVVIPMVSDAELVAAKAIEQIGKNINLAQDVINQIQLALIESCINAIEHSGSYDRKIIIRFSVSPERLEIVIESPGRFFDPSAIKEPMIEEKLQSGNKRGWGLSLMRKIMDEVRVERADNLTRVILVKKIRPNEVMK
jgi:anti-sigma regulatory factor (Ser/Thr protein kinase)